LSIKSGVVVADDGRDQIQQIDVPTNLPFPERHAVAADGLLKGSPAQFPSSSLPAPPRLSNLLRPPPRVGTQKAGVDCRDRDRISSPVHDRATAHLAGARLMPDNAVLPGLAVGGGWFPPRHSQRGTNDRHSNWLNSGRDSRSRQTSSDKYHYRRAWHHPDRDCSYPPRRRQSSESKRYNDEMEDAVTWQSDAGSIDHGHDDDTSLVLVAASHSETLSTVSHTEAVSVDQDKECGEVSSCSTVSHSETATSS